MKQHLNKTRWIIAVIMLLSTYFAASAKGNRCTKCNPCYAPPIIIPLHQSDIILMYAEDFYSYMSVSVQRGEVYSFKVVRQHEYVDFTEPSNADGWDNKMLEWKWFKKGKRVDTAKCYALCGAIGASECDLFSIGCCRNNFTIPATGNMHFFANDHKNFYWNNKGYLWIRVTREK